VDNALIDAIQQRFGRRIGGVSQLQHGEYTRVWRAETDGAPVVVHLSPKWRSIAELAWSHRVIGHATAHAPQAIAPLPSLDGSTVFLHERRPVSVFPFVEGQPLDRNDDLLAEDSARVLARIHRALADWDGGPRPASGPNAPAGWNPDDDPPELVDAELDDWWTTTSGSLPAGVIHGDYCPHNLVCRRQRVAAVIDWHDARIATIASEVAWAAWEVAQDDQLNFRPDRAARFLHAYRQDAPALELAIPLIRAGLRESIRIILAEQRDGLPIDQEYLTLQLRAFHELRR
jgi:Ser/Thr protein kinase RdoA (MazF antagonist)